MMKVVEMRESGGPEVLQLGRRPVPVPSRAEVRVRVATSGVNRADLLQRRGRYPAPMGEPHDVLGLEYSGVVEALGEGCILRKVGDPVMGILAGGGYSELIVVPERATIRVPEPVPIAESGAIPEAFITAWDALLNQAGLQSGETVLIHAVGSGVGTAALQLARVLGATTVGTSRTAHKISRALDMGLDHGLTASDPGAWAPELSRAGNSGFQSGAGNSGRPGNSGVDVILDLVGESYVSGNLDALSVGGRWIVVGVPSGAAANLDLRKLMGKRAILRGTVLRARPAEEKARLAREFERTVVPLFERGMLRPVVDQYFPVGQAAEAHAYLEENRTFGKVLLSWD